MAEFFFNGPGLMVFLLFYWVPFAVGAYLVDIWAPEHGPHAAQKLLHPIRQIRHMRSVAHAH